MPFWKKSEDPWDQPVRRPQPRPAPDSGAETGQEENTAQELREMFRELGKGAREFFGMEEKEPEPEVPPQMRPWCGKEMEVGYLCGGRDYVRLVRQRPGALRLAEDALYIRGDGTFWCDYKIAWTCGNCRKLVADLPEPEETWDNDILRGEAQENQHEGEN